MAGLQVGFRISPQEVLPRLWTRLLIASDVLSDEELTALKSFWMWETPKGGGTTSRTGRQRSEKQWSALENSQKHGWEKFFSRAAQTGKQFIDLLGPIYCS